MHIYDNFIYCLLAPSIIRSSVQSTQRRKNRNYSVVNLRASHRKLADETSPEPSAPSRMMTTFPTQSKWKCDDTDGDFYDPITEKREPCIWLQDRPNRIPTLCEIGSEARSICPETCGSCLDECFDTTKKFLVDSVKRNCVWLRIRPGQQEIYCSVGQDAYYACPETCNACDGIEFPSLAPSKYPSLRPTFKDETYTPSVYPSISLSPTTSPTLQFCDDTDGNFFEPQSNKNQPCIWLMARPELIQTLCVENSEVSRVCPETCGACRDSCEDTNDFFFINDVKRDCEWLRVRPNFFPLVCIPGGAAHDVCPETCNVCDGKPPCKDTEMSFYVPETNTHEQCIWFQSQLEMIPYFCPDPNSNASTACPKTCGNCDGDGKCKDTKKPFQVEDQTITCEWLKVQEKSLQGTMCTPGSEVYISCPKTCNSCESSLDLHLSPPRSSANPTALTMEPDSPPTPLTTPSPTVVTCDDDYENKFFVDSVEEYQGCLWLAARPNFQVKLCNPLYQSGAYNICEETCGKCSDRCYDTDQKFMVNEVRRDCEWLLLRPGKQEELCLEGNVALLACPETCNACESLIDEKETVAPEPIQAAPNRPTASICEDGFESLFLVESIQQRQGCLWLAARPDYQKILCNPLDPSGAFNVCEETCGKCSDECYDTDEKFIADEVLRDCTWLLLRPGKQKELCIEGSAAMTVCPETCNICEIGINQGVETSQAPSSKTKTICDDTDGFFFDPETSRKQPCIWLQDRPEFWPFLCYENSEASQVCPETCGTCEDDCEDTAGKFSVGNTKRDCEWLRLRPSMITMLCVMGSEAHQTCPETCNVCDG